jgi:hypothetical protein
MCIIWGNIHFGIFYFDFVLYSLFMIFITAAYTRVHYVKAIDSSLAINSQPGIFLILLFSIEYIQKL